MAFVSVWLILGRFALRGACKCNKEVFFYQLSYYKICIFERFTDFLEMKKPVILALTLGVIFISLTSFEFKKDQRLSTADFRLNGPVKLVYANTFQIAQKNSDELDLPVYSLPKIQEELNEIPDPDTWFMNYGKYSLLYVNFTEKGYLSERTQVFAGMALDRTIYAYDETNKLLWSSSYSMGEMATYATYKENKVVESFDYHGKDEKQNVQPLSKFFEYDSWNGRLKKVTTKDLRNNDVLFTYEMEYKGDSVLVLQRNTGSDSAVLLSTLKLDTKGRLLEREGHEDGKLSELELHTYDKKGVEIMRSVYNDIQNYTSEVTFSSQEIYEKRIHIGDEAPFETYKLVLSRPDEYGNWTLATLYHNNEQQYVILRTIRYYEK